MDAILDLLGYSLTQVWVTFTHNWPFLVVSVLIAVGLKLFLDPNQVAAFLMRYRRAGVVGATAAAVATPLCSCGTTAVILGMIASTMPWAPVVAFMVASPLTSPQELVYSAGLFGWKFALVFFASSIVLGLLGGAAAEFCETRGWLKNQARFAEPVREAQPAGTGRRLSAHSQEYVGAIIETEASCGCSSPAEPAGRRPLSNFRLKDARPALAVAGSQASELAVCCAPAVLPAVRAVASSPAGGCACGLEQPVAQPAGIPASACGCGGERAAAPEDSAPVKAQGLGACACSGAAVEQPVQNGVPARRVTAVDFAREVWVTGKRLVMMFAGFAFVGYFLNGLIPAEWVTAFFGAGNIYSVPLAATLGLPLYVNSEVSLPLVRAMIAGGMSEGAALAFLITGSGTSFGAVAGALTIARWRVIALVVGTLWVGAILIGLLYNLL